MKWSSVAFFTMCAVLALCQPVGRAQSDSAMVTGRVIDPANATVPGATITVLNVKTQGISKAVTNDDGLFTVSGLPPGDYRIEAAKLGFKTVIKPDVILHVQDVVAINFNMVLGSTSESVTVEGGGSIMNTTDGSVSTIVDRNFVENIPLNGRSFQDLILLTPGVVSNTPQTSAVPGFSGEFSVNGQRTESNYYTVDGVSANLGIGAGRPTFPGNSGSLPISTTLGTTQGLVSVDALEEFRVLSSTYSAEYGRNPGGQFDFVTRSGTNHWHGGVFDYLRNNVFDANDWFNNFFGFSKPPERQNDFGGTLGGPLKVPHLYKGKDKSFFFFSYEGLRLAQPQAAFVTTVPTVATRQSAATALQPVVNAFPIPNCPSSATNCATDLGNGFGQFLGTWSNPNSIDGTSLRIDQVLGRKVRFFFRFGNTASNSAARDLNDAAQVDMAAITSRTYTLGATTRVTNQVNDEVRLNYSTMDANSSTGFDDFGGAKPVNLEQLQGLNQAAYLVRVLMFSSDFSQHAGANQFRLHGVQRQWNLVDTLGLSLGRHQVRLGVDYRRLAPVQQPLNPSLAYVFVGSGQLQSNSPNSATAQTTAPAFPQFTNFSAFTQDEWRIVPRLSLSLGLRWEVNPAPGARKGNLPFTLLGDVNSPGTLQVAPAGTLLWHTSWYNFAPRLGMAYVLRDTPGFETVVRGGAGVFFDTGQQAGTSGYNGDGFSGSAIYCRSGCAGPAVFPLGLAQSFPAIVNPPVAPYGLIFGFPPHLQLPFTLQWNASLEQALGKSQAVTVSFVGANGRRLLQSRTYPNLSASNPNFNSVGFITNGLTSDYDALQIKLERRFSSGLQLLSSYTWAHSIDYGSRSNSLPYVRGNSDFDVRHNCSVALAYELPNAIHNGFARAVLHHWSLDDRFTARTGFPVTLNGRSVIDPVTLQRFNSGLNLIPGQPLYIYGSQFPGGRSINPGAFATPPAGQFGDAPRNFARGFGAWQMDLAIRREFPIRESFKLQFRAEAFNVFNHPNFGTINPFFCRPGPFCTFGQANATLAQSLGVLSSLYQMGGPRSLQFALKLMF